MPKRTPRAMLTSFGPASKQPPIPATMIRLRYLLSLGLALLTTALLSAQSGAKGAKDKSPGDAAADAYYALRDNKEAAVTGQRLQQVMAAGLTYLAEHPAHGRVSSVINSLATFGSTMRDKKLAPMLSYWNSQLKYEAVNRRTQAGISDELRAIWTTLEAAVAGYEVRLAPGRENLAAFREKIDRLADLPGASRFLSGQEKEFLAVLSELNPGGGAAYARKLLEHPDKKVATMAREELNLVEVRSKPYELTFTALDGREVDFAGLRGKAVLLFFWSAANENSLKDLDALAEIHRNYRLEFEIVTVCYDPETERAKVAKLVKDRKLKWPVYFDGQGKENAFGAMLNVRTLPAGFVFDKKGMMVANGLRANRVEAVVKKILGVK